MECAPAPHAQAWVPLPALPYLLVLSLYSRGDRPAQCGFMTAEREGLVEKPQPSDRQGGGQNYWEALGSEGRVIESQPEAPLAARRATRGYSCESGHSGRRPGPGSSSVVRFRAGRGWICGIY